MLLTGLVIITDWIVSDESRFPYMDDTRTHLLPSYERALSAWNDLDLPPCWEAVDEEKLARSDLYMERFDITPRPMQTAVANTILNAESPGIVVIEAPMGEGKTEAALIAAEILAAKSGRGGVFFALPTQATSDGIFPRMLDWIDKIGNGAPRAITLAHGKSRMNEVYQGIRHSLPNVGEDDERENVIVHDWFKGRKKGILADFVVGTVDHILMGGLKQKHLALRHLGLANKVVVIDECHVYDAYMNSYLYRILNWLGAYNTPVIILSATLPAQTRRKLIEAYMDRDFTPSPKVYPWLAAKPSGVASLPDWATSRAYPLVTYNDGEMVHPLESPPSGRRLSIQVAVLSDDTFIERLEELLSDGGGCAGIIVNTVKRAQRIAHLLIQRFGKETVQILHSHLIAFERVKREMNLRDQLGSRGNNRPQRLIVVGTQVMEQSLDVDFDVLVTDICPMDLLLQRMGRLQRHERPRPEKLKKAMCFITGIEEEGFEKGSEFVYGKYMLMNTRKLLPALITLPEDIPNLVQDAYAEKGMSILGKEYATARDEHKKLKDEKKAKAKAFQIIKTGDCLMDNILGLLDTSITEDPHGKRAEATVRDTGDSIEVLIVQRRNDGKYYTLPYLNNYADVMIARETPSEELAGTIANCSLKLPPLFTAPWNIDRTIKELEEDNIKNLPAAWQDSYWLKDELFLVLDENFEAELAGYKLCYDEKYGLMTKKEGKDGGKEV